MSDIKNKWDDYCAKLVEAKNELTKDLVRGLENKVFEFNQDFIANGHRNHNQHGSYPNVECKCTYRLYNTDGNYMSFEPHTICDEHKRLLSIIVSATTFFNSINNPETIKINVIETFKAQVKENAKDSEENA